MRERRLSKATTSDAASQSTGQRNKTLNSIKKNIERPVCRMTQRHYREEKILCAGEFPAFPLSSSEWNLRLHAGNNKSSRQIKQRQSSSASIENFATPSKLSTRLDRHSA